MLLAINDRIKGWLGIVIVVLIGLPFALWGISSYFDEGGPMYAAKVNDAEISTNELERTVSLQRQNMLRLYGGTLPFEDKVLRQRTLTQLINQRVLERVSFDEGYRISDPIVAAKIKQQFTVDGVFDRARFEASVASFGMSIPMYEDALRNELRVDQMQSAIAVSAFVTNKELNELASLKEQQRDISVLTFDVEKYSSVIKPTQEEIQQYYDANRYRFMQPEKIKIDYVEITSELLAKDIKIDETDIQKMYDDYVTSISGREERKARHILLQVSEDKAVAKKKIQALKQELENGSDFAELAKKHSQDPASAADGGDLGWVALGEMAKPFEQVLFDLELADSDMSGNSKPVVSDIVETQFGYHLIQLDDIRSEAVEPLAVKRYEIEAELKADIAASMFYDLSERLASIAYENPDSLELVVEELGLEIKTSDEFTRTQGEGIAANEQLRNIAFSALVVEQGSNSDIVEVSDAHVVVLRLNQHIPEKAIPLEEVRSGIIDSLVTQNSYKLTKAAVLEVQTKIDAGKNINSFQSASVKLEKITNLGRRDNVKVSSPSVLRNAFDMSAGEDGKPSTRIIDLETGDIALVVLTALHSAEEISPEQIELVKNELVREHADRDFSNVLLSIKNNASIEINRRVLDR